MQAEPIRIGNRLVGPDQPVFVIAEAGVAHFGSLDTAFRLVDLAVEARADAVKFQIYTTDRLISHECPEWQNRMRSKELSYEAFFKIKSYCDQRGILFLATAHEESSADFLESLDVPAYKIGSGEIDNLPFYSHMAKKGKPLLISTGLHDENAIRDIIAACHKVGNSQIILLHCNTAYPTPPKDSHLRSIPWMQEKFRIPVGYSDHTIGIAIPLAAVALGACLIEKHICLRKDQEESQDCHVACDAEDMRRLVEGIREIEVALGTPPKTVPNSCRQSLQWARKSLTAKHDLKAGSVITEDVLIAKRPGTGISPKDLNKVVGKRLKKDVARDCLIRWEDLV